LARIDFADQTGAVGRMTTNSLLMPSLWVNPN
jgi:hypothetical protein